MQITVFGASGKIGSLVVEQLLKEGQTVVAFVHDHNLFSPSGQLIIVKGDVYKSSDVASALEGSSAVVSCLGSWGTPKRNVLTSAMKAIIPAMEAAGIMRLVTLTGSGALAPGEIDGAVHKLVMTITKPFPAGKVFQDGEDHMTLLAASSLNWTTIRSPVMTNGGSKECKLSLKAGGPFDSISRLAVVRAILQQVDTATFERQAPFIHRA